VPKNLQQGAISCNNAKKRTCVSCTALQGYARRGIKVVGSIPFTRSIDNQALTMQCSKSAVESNWKNQSQEERRSGKRKSFQWEAPKKIPAEEMGITNRQLLSAFIRHPNEARPGSHPITT
jgi:hypothetical protein